MTFFFSDGKVFANPAPSYTADFDLFSPQNNVESKGERKACLLDQCEHEPAVNWIRSLCTNRSTTYAANDQFGMFFFFDEETPRSFLPI